PASASAVSTPMMRTLARGSEPARPAAGGVDVALSVTASSARAVVSASTERLEQFVESMRVFLRQRNEAVHVSLIESVFGHSQHQRAGTHLGGCDGHADADRAGHAFAVRDGMALAADGLQLGAKRGDIARGAWRDGGQ